MQFYLPDNKQTSKKGSGLYILSLIVSIGLIWFFVASDSTTQREQRFETLQNKLNSSSNSFTDQDKEEFCRLLLEIKKISIPNCDTLDAQLLKALLGLSKEDFRFFQKFSAKFNPGITIRNHLKGSGQLRNFTASPNLKGVDPDDILNRTTIDLIDFLKEKLKDRKITESQIDRIIRQINKTLEERDLNPVQRK